MAFEMLLGMEIINDEGYSNYRREMTPILTSYQGKFGYDFKISEVLISEENPAMNRVFTLNFVDKAHCDAMFSDPAYLAIKKKHFVDAVGKITRIASYEK